MKKLIILMLFVTASLTSFAQVDRSKVPEAGPAPEIKLGEYEQFTLDNGLKVFVVENDKLPRVNFSLIIDRDPILEGENNGYIGMAGQLLGTATTTKTKAEIDEAIDFIGADLGTSSTSISGGVLKKFMNEYLQIMSDILLNPVFTQEELDKLKLQATSALKQAKDDPDNLASRVAPVLLYGKDHPYGEVQTEENIENINLELCQNYYDTYFKPNTAYLAVVGDIDVDEAKPLVEKYFGSWQKGDVPAFTYDKPHAPTQRQVALVDRSASVQSVIRIGYPVDLKTGSEDVIKANIMNTILGGSFLARVNQNLREDKGYTYGAYTAISSDELVGRFYAVSTVRNEVTDSAVTEFLNELERIKNEKVSEQELRTTQNYMTGGFARSLESPGTIANFAINVDRYNLPKDYYTNYLKRLNAVTVDDVYEAAQKYIKPDNSYIIIVGNGDEVAESLKKFSADGEVNYFDADGNLVVKGDIEIPADMDAGKVIDNYIEAVGGKKKLSGLEDKTMVLKGEDRGVEIKVTVVQKAPHMLKQTVDAGVFKQEMVYDGTRGKQTAMGQVVELEGKDLEDTKVQATLNMIMKLDELGINAELKGIDNLDGNHAYKVVLTMPFGDKWVHYYDIETGYLIQQETPIETPQGSFMQKVVYSDYREVDGIKFPFKYEQNMGPQTIDLTVESIEINKGVNNELFEVK